MYQVLSSVGVQAHAIRAHEGRLVIPVRDAGEQLCSLQFISEDGGKWFLPGGKITGHYFSFGEPKGRVLIAEGYATAASLHEATGDAVAVAFNAGNLKAVALALSEKLPDVDLVICCDNDKAGTEKGKAAAEVIFSKYCIPKFDGGTDFNDLHQQQGLEAVSAVVQKARVSLTQRAKQVALLPPLEADEAIASITANFPVSKEAFRKEVKIYVKQQQEIDENPFPEETPWPDRVDGLRLADELEAHYTRHVIIPQGAASVLAIWTLHMVHQEHHQQIHSQHALQQRQENKR